MVAKLRRAASASFLLFIGERNGERVESDAAMVRASLRPWIAFGQVDLRGRAHQGLQIHE
eukprot:gene10066-1104_t